MTQSANRDFRPCLLVKGDASSDGGTAYDFLSSLIDRMTEASTFNMPGITVAVKDASQASNVTLVLSPHDGLEPDGFSLSGLPKGLTNECIARSIVRSRKPSQSASPNMRSSPASSLSNNNNSAFDNADAISLNLKPRRKYLWAPNRGPLAGLKATEPAEIAPEVLHGPLNSHPLV